MISAHLVVSTPDRWIAPGAFSTCAPWPGSGKARVGEDFDLDVAGTQGHEPSLRLEPESRTKDARRALEDQGRIGVGYRLFAAVARAHPSRCRTTMSDFEEAPRIAALRMYSHGKIRASQPTSSATNGIVT